MKEETFSASEHSAEDPFLEAALVEQVRLGSEANDEDLVRSILLQTVERSQPLPFHEERARHDRRLWAIGLISAAAAVAALATVLAFLPFRSSSQTVEELRFVVQLAPEALSSDIFSRPQEPSPQREAFPEATPITTKIGKTTPLVSSFSLPQPLESIHPDFSPSFTELPKSDLAELRIRVSADETERFAERRVYSGNVKVRHERFRLTSEYVELDTPETQEAGATIRLVAAQALLEQTSAKHRAFAEEIEYEPATGRFSLKGVVYLETPEGNLNSFAPDDIVYLFGDTLIVRKGIQAP